MREIVRDAAVEVRKPTLFGELIIAIVYLSILALEGIEGKLFRPMALTVLFALAGSMLLSVTVMPVLASFALEKWKHGDAASRPMRALARVYRPLLARALARPGLVLGIAAVLVVNTAFLATRLGAEFVPRLREQAIVINTVRAAGVSLEESVRYGTRLERTLLEKFPDEIEHVWTRTGTAEVATDPMGMEVSDVFLTLTPRERWKRGSTQDELVAAMSEAIEGMPGMRAVFTQPIEMRMNEMIAGVRADVGVKLFGRRKVGEVVEGQRRFDLVLRLDDASRASAERPLRVFTGVPFAAVGGVFALWARGLPFSISAGVGFVALFGVAVLGDMVLVSRAQRSIADGTSPLDAIREAAETRLRPVLMTALVAALGFVPMAFNTGIGAEVQRPLATVVIGGLVSSTVATLFVLPVLYAVVARRGGETHVAALRDELLAAEASVSSKRDPSSSRGPRA